MAGATDIKTEAREHKPGKSGASSGGGASSSTSMPKDAQVMVAILKDMGVHEYEPRVVNQLLEFSYRYATNILEDARAVSSHARKKAVDLDDVKLAVQMYAEQNVTTPPSREILLDMARTKNAVPLPVPKPTCGLRLPPDRHCLTACNYRVKFRPKPRPPGYGGAATVKAGSVGQRYGLAAAGGAPKTVGGAMKTVVMPQQPAPGFSMVRAPVNSVATPKAGKINNSSAADAAPKFQINLPAGVAVQAPVQISVTPKALASVTQPLKRKADEMDEGKA